MYQVSEDLDESGDLLKPGTDCRVDDLSRLGKKARIWGKKRIERESYILGNSDESNISPADFVMPQENNYSTPPPAATVELRSLQLLRSVDMVHPSPLSEFTATPLTESFKAPDLPSHPAKLTFSVIIDGKPPEDYSFSLLYDISFVTAHPCAPSRRARFLKSPSSPTIQQFDLFGANTLGKDSRSVYRAGEFLGAAIFVLSFLTLFRTSIAQILQLHRHSHFRSSAAATLPST